MCIRDRQYSGESDKEMSSNCLWVKHHSVNEEVFPGIPSEKNAKYIIEIFENSVNKTISGEFEAVVTCPINKEVINKGGIPFTGHTEELSRLSNTKKVVMMLASENMRVALLTTHIPLTEVPSRISTENLKDTINIVSKSLKEDFGISNPVIKVLGLNPHAGDGGYIGKEEEKIIIPLIKKLNKSGENIIGPISADTAFIEKGSSEKADVFIAMFHDQGLPVIKTSSFGGIVNITTKTGGSDWSSRVGVETSLGAEASTDPDKLYTDGYQNVNFDFGGPISENIKVYLSVESKEKGGDVSYSYFPMMDAMPMQERPKDDARRMQGGCKRRVLHKTQH